MSIDRKVEVAIQRTFKLVKKHNLATDPLKAEMYQRAFYERLLPSVPKYAQRTLVNLYETHITPGEHYVTQ